MKKALAIGFAVLLLAAGIAAAVALTPADNRDEDPTHAHAGHAAHDDHDAAHAHGPRVARTPGDGEIPDLLDAALRLDRLGDVRIVGDDAFNPANGVRAGSGTPQDPYVISGWFVDTVLIAETTACYEFKENHVSRILILDWTGPCGLVHHNHLNDFRTNRNVARTQDPTAAVVTQNHILHVTELRHFDGVLTDNVIGDPERLLPGPDVVLNIQGLNGATITRNHVHGGVDMKLHGHHHSSHHGAPSHNHGVADEEANRTGVDHSVRHISFRFTGNVIESDRFGLRYNDLNHAGDDRQATSEQEPTLEDPHTHHTTVRIDNNTIRGAGLRVAVFNAPDELHLGNEGVLVLENNVIEAPLVGDAVLIHDVRDAEVLVSGNQVKRGLVQLDAASGIHLLRFQNVTVHVNGNEVPGFRYGVRAQQFDANTTWTVTGNHAPGARHDVYWDSSVANPPESHEPRAGDEHDHGHHDGATAADVATRVARALTGR